jgi:hypothetical protein
MSDFLLFRNPEEAERPSRVRFCWDERKRDSRTAGNLLCAVGTFASVCLILSLDLETKAELHLTAKIGDGHSIGQALGDSSLWINQLGASARCMYHK